VEISELPSLSGELTVDGLTVRVSGYRDEIYIDRLGIDTPSFLALLDLSDPMKLQQDGFPEYLGFIVEGMRIPVDADYFDDLYEFAKQANGVPESIDAAAECTGKYGFSPAALAELGYQEQVMDMLMSFHDEESRFTMKMDVSIEEMWDMDVKVTLAGNMMNELARGTMAKPRFSARMSSPSSTEARTSSISRTRFSTGSSGRRPRAM